MRSEIKIRKLNSGEIVLDILTNKGTIGHNLLPLKKSHAKILSETLGIEIDNLNCEDKK